MYVAGITLYVCRCRRSSSRFGDTTKTCFPSRRTGLLSRLLREIPGGADRVRDHSRLLEEMHGGKEEASPFKST